MIFQSQDAHARRYEQDLLNELLRDGIAGRVLLIGEAGAGALQGDNPLLSRALSAEPSGLSDSWLTTLWLILAQQYALHRSVALGLTPDNPFPDGTVNRVVQGVEIYPYVESARVHCD